MDHLSYTLRKYKKIERVMQQPTKEEFFAACPNNPVDTTIIVVGRHLFPQLITWDIASFFDIEHDLKQRCVAGKIGTIFGMDVYSDLYIPDMKIPNVIRIQRLP